jgi:hypothetical protein
MTPEDKQLLEVYIKEIAKIFYKNTPPDEGIETSVHRNVESSNKTLLTTQKFSNTL